MVPYEEISSWVKSPRYAHDASSLVESVMDMYALGSESEPMRACTKTLLVFTLFGSMTT